MGRAVDVLQRLRQVAFNIADGVHQVAAPLPDDEVVALDFDHFPFKIGIFNELDRRVPQERSVDLRVFVRVNFRAGVQFESDLHLGLLAVVDQVDRIDAPDFDAVFEHERVLRHAARFFKNDRQAFPAPSDEKAFFGAEQDRHHKDAGDDSDHHHPDEKFHSSVCHRYFRSFDSRRFERAAFRFSTSFTLNKFFR